MRFVPSTREGGAALTQLNDSLSKTLRDSYQANLKFASDIDADPTLVWRYPPLIDAALADLLFNDPSVEFRAAYDRMTSSTDDTGIATLSIASGVAEGAAILLAAAPEVLVALAVINSVVSAVTTVSEFITSIQNQQRLPRCPNPSKALASEPSYAGVVLNVAATLLDVKGFADALRTARFASKAAAAESLEVIPK